MNDIRHKENGKVFKSENKVKKQSNYLLTEIMNTLKKAKELPKLLLCLPQMKEKLMQIVSRCSPSR